MILDIRINKFHSQFDKTKNISQRKHSLPKRLRHSKIIILRSRYFHFEHWKRLCESSAIPLAIPFHTWKISCFEHISHACLFTRVSFGTLSVSNSSLLWTKALACKTISTMTLIVLLIHMRISEKQVVRLACRVITRVPVCSPFSLFSHGHGESQIINRILSLVY